MRRNATTFDLPAQEPASTGIAGFDEVLGGCLPTDHVDLIEGERGSRKAARAGATTSRGRLPLLGDSGAGQR